MKKQRKTIDKVVVVFRKKTTNFVRKFSGGYYDVGPYIYKSVPFPSHDSAMVFVTKLKLGFDDGKGAWQLHNGWLSKDWRPMRVERKLYRPGKGTVWSMLHLGGPNA